MLSCHMNFQNETKHTSIKIDANVNIWYLKKKFNKLTRCVNNNTSTFEIFTREQYNNNNKKIHMNTMQTYKDLEKKKRTFGIKI